MTSAGERGTLFVVSAPSGTGKSSLTRRVLDDVPRLAFSVSYTTRAPRSGELSGREYHFVDDARFDAMVASDGFIEWAHVYGRRYGTGRDASERVLASGCDLLLDIDVQGAERVKGSGAPAVFVFVLPPDYATLETRLRSRGTEDPASIARRLAQARVEAAAFETYDYVVVNDDLDRAAIEIASIVRAERARRPRRDSVVRGILATFPAAVGRPEER